MKKNNQQRHITVNYSNVVISQDLPVISQVWSGLYLGLKVAPVAAVLLSMFGWTLSA